MSSKPKINRGAKGKKELPPQQKLFCYEYVKDLNATKAAERTGYSKKTAQEQSSRLLSKVIIKRFIARLQAKQFKKLEISADKVLNEAARLAFFDIRKAFNENELKNIQDLDDDTAAAIAGIETEELFEGRGNTRKQIGLARKIKTHDKKGAIELLMKHLKLLNSEVELPEGTIINLILRKAKKDKNSNAGN